MEPIIADLILAMVELGVPITGLNEFARRRTAKAVTTPGQVISHSNYLVFRYGVLEQTQECQTSEWTLKLTYLKPSYRFLNA